MINKTASAHLDLIDIGLNVSECAIKRKLSTQTDSPLPPTPAPSRWKWNSARWRRRQRGFAPSVPPSIPPFRLSLQKKSPFSPVGALRNQTTCNYDKRVIWIFVFLRFSLSTTDASAEERGCVWLCQLCLRRFVGHWVGSTLDNWEFSNIVNYYNIMLIMQSI